MKKILILVMSCRLPYYRDREREIADTFANPILKGEFPEMDLWFFNSGTKNCHDTSTHRIFVEVDDRRDRTFQKVCKTLKYVNDNPEVFGKYDYVVRLNISTVLNPKRLRMFVDHLEDDSHIWTCTSYNQNWVADGIPFFGGECYILSRKNVDLILRFYDVNKKEFDRYEQLKGDSSFACDDGWMTIGFSKIFRDSYQEMLRTFGIVYEPTQKLNHTDMYPTHIAICHKTSYTNEGRNINAKELDKTHIFDEDDRIKRRLIWDAIVQDESMEDSDEWWDYFKTNILDKECRSTLDRNVENGYCTKDELFDKWKSIKKKQ